MVLVIVGLADTKIGEINDVANSRLGSLASSEIQRMRIGSGVLCLNIYTSVRSNF